MGERDHSIECDVCGKSYGGFDGPDECPDMVYVETSPGEYERRHRRFGECFCYAREDGECACGGLWEQRQAERAEAAVELAYRTLAANLATAAALCLAWAFCHYHDSVRCICSRRPEAGDWRPGCGRVAPGWRSE